MIHAFLLALLLASAPYDDLFEEERGEYVLLLQFHVPNAPTVRVWRFGLSRDGCIAALDRWQNDDKQDMAENRSDVARGTCVHERKLFGIVTEI